MFPNLNDAIGADDEYLTRTDKNIPCVLCYATLVEPTRKDGRVQLYGRRTFWFLKGLLIVVDVIRFPCDVHHLTVIMQRQYENSTTKNRH